MDRYATIDSIKKKESEDVDSDSQEYYAGGYGGQRGGSGLSVVGPSPNAASRRSVDDILSQALANGSNKELDADSCEISICMYRSGFTVNDGPYRRLDDPANKPFLDDLSKGYVPRELSSTVKKGSSLNVKFEDKRAEEYVPSPYIPFSGSGQSMGSSISASPHAVVEANCLRNLPQVDETSPTTVLQIRLHDGRRIQHRFNHQHTLMDVQAVISSNGAGVLPYILMSGFPPTILTSFTQSLKEAGLLGAQITQKLH